MHDREQLCALVVLFRDPNSIFKQAPNTGVAFVKAARPTGTDEGIDLAAGQTVYDDNCAACHGEDLKGIQDVGAPSLLSANYLYGKSLDAIKAQINNPRNGVMPAWVDRLDPATIKSLTVYVHSFGGGQ